MSIINNLPVYCDSEIFNKALQEFEVLKNTGSIDDWVYKSFNCDFPYWEEIKLIPDLWEILEKIVEDNNELKFEINMNDDYIICNSIIREKVQNILTEKYKTLLFEKLNMILTIMEEAHEISLMQDNEEIILPEDLESSSFYKDIHEKFYHKFII